MAKSCSLRKRNWVITWLDKQGCINAVTVGTNKYSKLCPSLWSTKSWGSGCLSVPIHGVPQLKPPAPILKRLVLPCGTSLHISSHYSAASFSVNFHQVVDPPDLCEYWKCLHLGLEREVRNAISYLPWKLLSQILYWIILVHLIVGLWLSFGAEVVPLTLKDVNSRIYWHIL